MTKKNLENYLIAYPLFCNSKKFSLRNYLLSNKSASYKEFRKFLINKSVQPPREEYFNLVKMSVEKEANKSDKSEVSESGAIKDQQKESVENKKNTTKRSYKKRKTKVNEENTDE